MNQSERRTILIQVLLKEHPEYRGLRIPADADTQWQLLRGLLNIREPRRIGTETFCKYRMRTCKRKSPQKASPMRLT